MTPDELRERIARGEDPHTDFKRTVDRNADLARDLVCFANSDGGQLIIGVADDRTVVGVQDVDALMLRVDDVAFNLCSPPVTAVPETVPFDGHDVVVLNVAKGDQRPYSTRDGRYYIRAGARCRQASREELLRLFQAAQSLFYDEQPLPRLSIKDLDGGLFDLVAQAEAFLNLYLRTGHEIVGFEPEKREEIPAAALREAVINALVHRDYTIPGPTRIFVLADRVEVRSPGRPPNSVDVDAMRAGVHVTRNPHIYSRVADAQLATRAGTGIRRIARLLRENGNGQLGIRISEAEVALTLPRT